MSLDLGRILDPVYVARRTGVLDAIPRALRRTTGALSLLSRAREPAPVAPTPFDVIAIEGSARLLRYRPTTATTHAVPVVLVPSLINRFYVLDLMKGLSLVEALLEKGIAVYLVDWAEPLPSEQHHGLASYALHRLGRLLDAARADAGVSDVHLLGQCLGGTMTAIHAAVHKEGIRSLIHLTAPMSFHDDGILSAWSRAPFFDARAFAELFGNVPSYVTQPSFLVLRPLGQPAKMLRLFQNLGDERFLATFRCMETWINDNVSIPKAFYVDLIERLYREDALVKGTLILDDKPVLLEEIEVPVLTVAASEDHIVPVASATAGDARFATHDKKTVVIPGGHIGIVVGQRGRKRLVDEIVTWLAAHAPAKRPSPRAGVSP